MADESGDMDMGYMDDDIQLDDDDEEMPPAPSAATMAAPVSLPPGGLMPPSMMGQARGVKKPPRRAPPRHGSGESAPRPGDLLLRPGGKAGRDLVLARFHCAMPDLTSAARVRFYREDEGTERGRTSGLKSHKEQLSFTNTYLGKQRMKKLGSSGGEFIPDRAKKAWRLEITPQGVVPRTPPREHERDEDDEAATTQPGVVSYSSTYEGGQSTAKYALFVMSADGKSVDVVPVGTHARFNFRPDSGAAGADAVADPAVMGKKKVKDAEAAEKLMKKAYKSDKFAKIERNLREKTEERELMSGYRFGTSDTIALGIRRKVNAKLEAEKAAASGDNAFDFEAEFDNDDVAQIDVDEQPKSRKREKTVKRDRKAFDRLIKDEAQPITKLPSSPNSESDENSDKDKDDDDAQAQQQRPITQVKQELQPLGRRTVKREPIAAPAAQASAATATKAPLNVAHLLPASGELATRKHVDDVLVAIMKWSGKNSVLLQDILMHFQRDTKEQKRALQSAIRSAANMRKVKENDRNVYYVERKQK